MSNLMRRRPDSRIIGGYDVDGFDDGLGDYDMGDLVGDDMGDLVGDLELGRVRRRQRHRAQALAHRMGMTMMPAQQAAQLRAQARRAQLQSLSEEAQASGETMTAGHYVADGGQREYYLPFAAAVTIAAAAASTATLTAAVQRPMNVRRIILDSLDATTLADVLATLGVTSILNGVSPLFNAQGVAPARAFAFNAVGNHLNSNIGRVGQSLTIAFTRMVAGANPASISGYLVGTSAEI